MEWQGVGMSPSLRSLPPQTILLNCRESSPHEELSNWNWALMCNAECWDFLLA